MTTILADAEGVSWQPTGSVLTTNVGPATACGVGGGGGGAGVRVGGGGVGVGVRGGGVDVGGGVGVTTAVAWKEPATGRSCLVSPPQAISRNRPRDSTKTAARIPHPPHDAIRPQKRAVA
jgi:hypothetical protein